MKRTVLEAAAMARGTAAGTLDASVIVEGVSIDSRTIRKGNLFVPILGETFDGHDYVFHAIQAGAAAVMWQADRGAPPESVPVIVVEDTVAGLQSLASAYRQQLHVKIIGITGSNGKTTTKDMTAAVLSQTYKVHKTEGNLNNHLGLPLTLLSMTEDTDIAVLEMGMSSLGEIALLSQLSQPDVAIITNIGEAHLVHLGSREAIAAAKLEILTGMPHDSVLIYRGDEPLLEQGLLAIAQSGGSGHEPPRLIRFGTASTNDVYPVALMMDEDGTQFTVNESPDSPLRIPMWGRHNIINASAAIATGRLYNVPWSDIQQGLKQLKPTGMRAEISRTDAGVTIINEAYNASPTAMRAALELLSDLGGFKRKFAVIGDMLDLGDQEEAYHTEIGHSLDPRSIDYVLTYGRLAAFAGQEAGRKFPTGHVLIFQDKDALIAELRRLTADGDVVLVKGSRGLMMEEIVSAFQ